MTSVISPRVCPNLWACLAVAKTVFTNVLWLESSKLGRTFILDDSEVCVMVLMLCIALDSRKKCATPSKMSYLIIYALLYESLETPVWEKLYKSYQMNCVVCQNQNGFFPPAHLIFLWLKMYSLWGRCYHVGCGMARKANLVEKLAGVSHLIEINTKPL